MRTRATRSIRLASAVLLTSILRVEPCRGAAPEPGGAKRRAGQGSC